MANCPPELLDELADLFASVRRWASVIEKRPGVFYVANQPFLHFHVLGEGRRRADVKGRVRWVQLDIPRPVIPTRRRALVRELRIHYFAKVETKSCVRRRSPNHTLQRTGARDALPRH